MQLHGWHGRARLWATAILVGGASWLAFGSAVPTATASTQMASGKVAHLAAPVTYNPGSFVAIAATPSGKGYWLAQAGGGIYSFGDAHFYGSLPQAGVRPAAPVVGMAATSDGGGYWLVGSDGGIFAFGDASFHGSTGTLHLNKPIVGMAATTDDHGYWLVASDGGVFAFGDAVFYGSTGSLHLNKPIVGMTTDNAVGYWLVASDGGVFNFGDAQFHGSTGALHLNQPMVGMAFSPNFVAGVHGPGDYAGYWLVAADGGIFGFGTANFFGSSGSLQLNAPIVGMASTPDGQGYWLVGSDGGVFSFGDAGFHGSATGPPPACVGSQFAAAVTTSGSTFAPGQTIPITLTITNVGQPCESYPGGSGNTDVLDGCPYVVATNASGQSVWNSTANPYGGSGCGASGRSGIVPTGWSQTLPFSWNQLECPVSGSGCTQIQAPPGTYTIAFGEPNDIWVGVTVKPTVVSIG